MIFIEFLMPNDIISYVCFKINNILSYFIVTWFTTYYCIKKCSYVIIRYNVNQMNAHIIAASIIIISNTKKKQTNKMAWEKNDEEKDIIFC